MPKTYLFTWGLAVGLIALLNIVEALPDWTTIAAVLTLPLFASAAGMRCVTSKGRGA